MQREGVRNELINVCDKLLEVRLETDQSLLYQPFTLPFSCRFGTVSPR
jgi:hypothetical protein